MSEATTPPAGERERPPARDYSRDENGRPHPPEVLAELDRLRAKVIAEKGFDPAALPDPPAPPPLPDLLEALAEAARLHPEVRFGQLVCILASDVNVHGYRPDVWDVEDAYLLDAARRHLASVDWDAAAALAATHPARDLRPADRPEPRQAAA